MTTRITSPQKRSIRQLTESAVDGLNLTKDGAQRVITRGGVLQVRFKEMVRELAAEFYILLTDEEAIAWLVKQARKSEAEARQVVDGFRKKARAAGVADTVSIHAEVFPGGTFKRDIPQMGPTWEDFKYLQGWNFPDPPTDHALVSWVPVPLAGSTEKDIAEQAAMVAAFKAEAGLPAWHEVSFGSVNHVGGLALAHYKATGQDPFAGKVVRTDTCDAVGRRLELFWHEGRLYCAYWYWVVDRHSDIAVFAVGVVEALGR